MSKKSDELLKNWEFNFIFTLIILLVIATIMDLGIPFQKIFETVI